MGHSVERGVILGPALDLGPQVRRKFLEGNEGFRTMLADQTALQNVAAEQRQDGGAAAGSFGKAGRDGGQALEPDLAVEADLGRQAVGADQGMGEAPDPALQLAQGLRQPAGEGQVVKFFEHQTVFLPERIGQRFSHGSKVGLKFKV